MTIKEQPRHEDVGRPDEDLTGRLRVMAGSRAPAPKPVSLVLVSVLLGSLLLLAYATPSEVGVGPAMGTVGSDAGAGESLRSAVEGGRLTPAAGPADDGPLPRLVRDITEPLGEGSHPKSFADLGGALVFFADDRRVGVELWASDGTEAGTGLLKDINPGPNGSNPPEDIAIVEGVLYFTASDEVAGAELWRSDGTEAGTVRVKDIRAGPNGSAPADHTNVGGVVYFAADDGLTGRELWRTDGTDAGTVLVRDVEPALNGSDPSSLTNADGVLYFVTGDGAALWKSDGTEAGTVPVKDIYPGGHDSVRGLTYAGGMLYFSACDDVAGCELWKTDGTEAGTVRVKDIQTGRESGGAYIMRDVDDVLYFTADDGIAGTELWKSDGTEEGTVLVKDIDPGGNHSRPFGLRNIDGVLYFTAADNVAGRELWKSDGTDLGTVRVKDIHPGPGGSGDVPGNGPWGLTTVNGILFFSACDAVSGCELWQTDGTEAGTRQVEDLHPGELSSGRSELTNVGGTLFFAADNGTTGEELWMLDPTPPRIEVPDGPIAEATGPDGAAVTYEATARDNLDGPVVPECTPTSGAMFPLGVTTVTCTAFDSSGNLAARAFPVTVRDTMHPELVDPVNTIVEATGPNGAVLVYQVRATDAVDPSPVVTCSPPSGSTFPLGTTRVACTMRDFSGNEASVTRTVTVRDTTVPALTDPEDVTAEATGPAGAVVTFQVTATDAVDQAPTVTCSPASGSTFPLGITSVTCEARDDSGNVATSMRTVTVRDTTKPTLHLPTDIVRKATEASGMAVTFEATAQDLVDSDLVVACEPASGSVFPIGATTVTCTATDDAGNAASGSFRVTIEAPAGILLFGVSFDPMAFLLLIFAIAFVTTGVLGAAAVLRKRRHRSILAGPKSDAAKAEPGAGGLTPGPSAGPRRKP